MGLVIKPTTRDAYKLFHEGSLALAEAERNGILCDREYCKMMSANLARQIKHLSGRISNTELGKLWCKRYGMKVNYDSDPQLRKILFDDLSIEATKFTNHKTPSVDAEFLSSLDREDASLLIKYRQSCKLKSTYIDNYLLESEADGYIHPFFHLFERDDNSGSGGARSFRGSSSDPNFQNNPNRKELERRITRRAFLARPGFRIFGRDYGSMEFRISACLHHDPNMIRYIEHGDDPHRDTSAKAFLLDPELCTKKYGDLGKDIRFVGKNSFTFAQMFFQEPENTARGLWKSIFDMNLRVPNDPDKTLISHLKDKKIRNYEAFQDHIVKRAVPWFWKEMFPVYGKWREKWLSDYNKNGYFDMMTGFRVEGVLSKYQLGNYPIQGPAFHCLLWSLTRVNDLWSGRRSQGCRSLIIGQIHDELTTDEPDDEWQKNQKEVPRIMAEDIREEWKWLIIPLEVETEATPVGGNWFEKGPIK